MRFPSKLSVAACLTALTLASSMSFAQAPPQDPAKAKAEARTRFNRAVQLSDEGDFERALAEFQKAYEILPNPHVLVNIAQIQAALNHPADTIETLDKALADSSALSPQEVEQANTLRAREAPKVAELSVRTNVDGAQLEVDNVAQGGLPRQAPLRVGSGQHLVAVYASGHAPMRKLVTVAGGTKESIDFQLVTIEARLAHLLVKTQLPGAKLSANGQEVGQTPFATTLTFVPGPYKLELTRPGYQGGVRELTLGDGATGEVTFELALDPDALAQHFASLRVRPSEPGSTITIDGTRRAEDVKLPPGPHQFVVEKAGFLKYERTIALKENTSTELSPLLVPTLETRADYESRTSRNRTIAYALLGIGGATLVAGGVLAVVFSNQRSDAQVAYDTAVAAGKMAGVGGCNDVCLAKFDDAAAKLDSAKTKQTVAFVGLGAGAVLAGVGGYWLLTSDDPHKYENTNKPGANVGPNASLRVRPFGGMLPGGGGMGGLSGSF